MTSRPPHWLIFLALLLAACCFQSPASPPPPAPSILAPWSYADLRLLDPADADLPSHDLVAVYLRRSGDDLQLRLDLLAGVDRLDYDLYLALQTGLGGTHRLPIQTQAGLAWDTLLVIPAAGPLQVLTPAGASRPGAALSVFRDPVDDAVLISLHLPIPIPGSSLSLAASPLQLQVFLTPAGSTPNDGLPSLADQTSILRSNDPPPAPANLLLAFWDVYPAYTPATALRRWDGAHTGPLGGHHGLYNLLRTANAAGVPLALLDLKDPASLSALDYAGGLELVRQMVESRLADTARANARSTFRSIRPDLPRPGRPPGGFQSCRRSLWPAHQPVPLPAAVRSPACRPVAAPCLPACRSRTTWLQPRFPVPLPRSSP